METSFADIILRKMKTMPGVDVSTIQSQPVPSTTDNNAETIKARQRKIPNFIFGTGKVLKPTKPKVQVIHKNTVPKDNQRDNDTIQLYQKFINDLIKKKKEKQRRTVVEHPEYNRDTNPYPSFGKKYAGEKGVISLTSWKARINTVYITLDSLIQQCPGFHIVLVLSEEEFPKMCKELPESLMNLVNSEKIEVLWVYKNYKSFKKVLFTMDKYRDVPIISADDDMIYVWNYADDLYNHWKQTPSAIISHVKSFYKPANPCGCAALYPPEQYKLFWNEFTSNTPKGCQDDGFFAKLCHTNNIQIIGLYEYYPGYFHDEIDPLNGGSINIPRWVKQQRFSKPSDD